MNVLSTTRAGEALTTRQIVAERIRSGRPAPALTPCRLSLAEIEVFTELFQPRSSGEWQSDSHVRTLAVGLKNKDDRSGERLQPVLVFWVGDAWALLDGHHRIAAIRGYLRGGAQTTIAVEVFSGTLESAKLEATRRNSRNKLAMTNTDKPERAWQHLLAGDGSHRVIALACDVSTKTVQRMQAVVRSHGGTAEGVEMLGGLRWWQARMLTSSTAMPPVKENAKRDDMVRRHREALAKVIKDNNPTMVGDGLISFNPALAEELMHHLFKRLSAVALPLGDDDLPQFPQGEHSEF